MTEEEADKFFQDAGFIRPDTSVRSTIRKLVEQIDTLIGNLVLLHAESGAPAPPSFNVAVERIRTLKQLAECVRDNYHANLNRPPGYENHLLSTDKQDELLKKLGLIDAEE